MKKEKPLIQHPTDPLSIQTELPVPQPLFDDRSMNLSEKEIIDLFEKMMVSVMFICQVPQIMSYNSHSGVKQRPLAVAEAVTAENCIEISFLDVKTRAFSPFRCPAVYFKAPFSKSPNFEIHLCHLREGGSQLCHTCEFLYRNAFWALCAAELKSNKKLSVHLFEVVS